MADLVDIVLPTHRRPHTIGCAVESVLRQTHADFRLHVVGDGCDDETEAAVRAFDDPRVRVYRFPKAAGYGYANRNTVLRRTDGEFVAYLCDDDLWFPDHLERGLAELGAGDLGLVAFRSCHVQYPDTLDPHFFAFDWRGPFATRFLRNWFMGSVTCVHRRRVFDSVGYARATDRLFSCQGYLKLVLYDARPASPSHGLVNEFHIGQARPTLVSVPPNVWHGVRNLGDGLAVVVNCPSHAYDYDDPDHYRLPSDTAEIPYAW